MRSEAEESAVAELRPPTTTTEIAALAARAGQSHLREH
jgi:hypothetical protein